MSPPSLRCWQAANCILASGKQSSAAPQRTKQKVFATAISVAARQAGHPLRLRLEGAPQGGELRLDVVDALHQRTLRRVVAVVHSSAPSPGLDLLFSGVAASDKGGAGAWGRTQRALIFISFTSGCGIWYPAKMTLSSECSCLCLTVSTCDASDARRHRHSPIGLSLQLQASRHTGDTAVCCFAAQPPAPSFMR